MRTVLALIIAACAADPATSVTKPDSRVPVEVASGGDDGLTQRLADAVRSEFAQSARFALAPASTPNVLTVTIPTHVGWEEVSGRNRVTYEVRLDRAGQKLAESRGVCWEHDLRGCAQDIVAATARALSL
jgi:hypothetical protein